MVPSWQQMSLVSLEVGATPLVRHFLERLQFPALFQRHLPPLPGRPPALPSGLTLTTLLTNLLLARQPLYALPAWVARRVPEHLGLQADQLPLLNDDRFGRALDHLQRAYARLDGAQASGRRREWRTAGEARVVGSRILADERVEGLLAMVVERDVTES